MGAGVDGTRGLQSRRTGLVRLPVRPTGDEGGLGEEQESRVGRPSRVSADAKFGGTDTSAWDLVDIGGISGSPSDPVTVG